MRKINKILLGVLFLIVIVGANWGAYRLPDYKLDLSTNRINSLSRYTKDTINSVKTPVEVVVYASNNLPGDVRPLLYGLRAILKSMEATNKAKFKLSIVDPSTSEQIKTEVAKYGIKELQFSSIKNDKFEVQKGYFGLVMKYGEKYEVLPVAGDVGNLEYLLVTGIKRLSSDLTATIALAEDTTTVQSGVQYLRKYLEQSYKVVDVTLDGEKEFPTEAIGLVIVGRSTKIDDKGMAKITKWVESSKPTVIFMDRVQVGQNMVAVKSPETGLEKLLGALGIKLTDGLVNSPKGAIANFRTQTGNLLVQYPYWLQISSSQIDKSHPTLSGINALLFPWASPIELSGDARALFWSDNSTVDDSVSDVSPNGLKSTASTGKTNVIGAVINNKVKLAVIGDKDFVTDQFVTNSQQNLAVALNLIDYMSGDSGIFEIRNKVMTISPLREVPDNIKNAIKFGNMIAPVFLLGAVYFLTRIRRSRRLN